MVPAIALALDRLQQWGVVPTPRTEAPAASALDMAAYEAGRPSAQAACRIGDARVLGLAAEEP